MREWIELFDFLDRARDGSKRQSMETLLREMRSAGVIVAGQVSWVEHSQPCSLRSTPTGSDRNAKPLSPDRRERQLKDE